jgi:hypothetical protein
MARSQQLHDYVTADKTRTTSYQNIAHFRLPYNSEITQLDATAIEAGADKMLIFSFRRDWKMRRLKCR